MKNKMQIQLFDVEHGSCALITTPNGKHVLIDCGHNDATKFRPSKYLAGLGLDGTTRRLAKLIISNVDQDHISDLPNVYNELRPEVLGRNKHIGRDFLTNVKEDITDAMESYIEMHETYTAPANPDLGGIQFTMFYHPPQKFDNTNDLSLVSFVQYGGLNIVFPGDLSKAAWLEFLKDEKFKLKLKETNAFVASHHGREDGYCPDVFEYCKPSMVLVSDESIQYDTQKGVNYSQHATGFVFGDNIRRKVLTTRNNGMISLQSNQTSNYAVRVQKA